MSKLEELDLLIDREPEYGYANWIASESRRALRLEDPVEDRRSVADRILSLDSTKQALEASLAAVNERLKQLNDILYEIMIEEDLPEYKTSSGDKFYKESKTHVKALNGYDDDNLVAWMRTIGLENLLQPKSKVNYQSLGGAIREKMKDHDPVTGEEFFNPERLPAGWEDHISLLEIAEVKFKRGAK